MNQRSLFPLLDHAATSWPDDIAEVRGTHRLTFRQLKSAAEELAAEFRRANFKPGDKIGLLSPNGPEYVIGSFALFLLDAVVVTIFPGLKTLEISELSDALRLNGLCYSPEFEASLPKELADSALKQTLDPPGITFCFQRLACDNLNNNCALELVHEAAPLIRFTSGTTSKAKGVIIP